ncbi:MAG TPA: hypothetical protein VGN00_15115 [Puia sp.]|jgi:hypothetical protein
MSKLTPSFQAAPAGVLTGRPAVTWIMPVAITFFCLSVGCFLFHFLLFRHSIPPNNIDESSFFSPAQSLAEHGVFSSPVHQGFLPGAGRYTYWMPPLYMLLLAGVFKIFGATVFNAKLLTFILTGLSAYLITLLSKDRYVRICLAGLFLVCPYIITASAFIRMEGLAILLLTASIVAVRFRVGSHWLGILAGLMVLTHPMLGPCCAALAFIVLRRGIRPFLIFCLLALVVVSPYLIYILQDLPVYKAQMGLQLARKTHKKLSDLQLDYVVQFVPLSLLALFALVKLRNVTESRIFLGVGLFLTMLLVLKSSEYNYQIYVMPFIIAVTGLVLDEKGAEGVYRYAVPLAVYAVFGIFLVGKLVKYRFRDDRPYNEMINYLQANRDWQGKNIYVDGTPDIATFLLMNHQQVERRNAVASEYSDSTLSKYNYIMEVTDNRSKDRFSIKDAPWQKWVSKKLFTTSDGNFTLESYIQ